MCVCAPHTWAYKCVGTKLLFDDRVYTDIYRLNNKTGDALFTHYSCQVNYHIQKFIDNGKCKHTTPTKNILNHPTKPISAVYLTFTYIYKYIYSTLGTTPATNRKKAGHFSQYFFIYIYVRTRYVYNNNSKDIVSESCHAPFVISINFIMFVITSKISDKTFSCVVYDIGI